MHALRYTVLAKTAAGSGYVAMYYKHAPEITRIFETQPDIERRARKIVVDLLPAIGKIIAHQKASIKNSMVQDGINLIDELSRHASPSLQNDLGSLKKDVQSRNILKTFGAVVR